MEIRELNVMFNKGGSGSISARVSIPKRWLDSMGLNEDNKGLLVTFDEAKGEIIIQSKWKEKVNRMEQIRKEAGVDSEGREAVLSWATIDRVNDGGGDEFIELYDSFEEAKSDVKSDYQNDSFQKLHRYGDKNNQRIKEVVLLLCNQDEVGNKEACFEDADGNIHTYFEIFD